MTFELFTPSNWEAPQRREVAARYGKFTERLYRGWNGRQFWFSTMFFVEL